MRINVIINPADRADVERVREEVERLRGAGHEVNPQLTFEVGDARRMARAAADAGVDLIVAAGGDGTVNEVANGIHDHLEEERGGGGVPRLAIVPLGTGNDFAGALEIPGAPAEALEVALLGRTREIDLGTVNGRVFVNVSSGGFGAEATEDASSDIKRALGGLAYVVTGVKKFVTLETCTARFLAEEPVYEGRFLLFAVGNSRRTGGGNWLTPRAELTDGLLDLCVVREMSRIDFVRLLPELRAGRHLDHPAVLYRQVPRVSVEAENELSVNVDGEPLEECRRFEYRLSRHRLVVMVP